VNRCARSMRRFIFWPRVCWLVLLKMLYRVRAQVAATATDVREDFDSAPLIGSRKGHEQRERWKVPRVGKAMGTFGGTVGLVDSCNQPRDPLRELGHPATDPNRSGSEEQGSSRRGDRQVEHDPIRHTDTERKL
jgi:hypothetical protein